VTNLDSEAKELFNSRDDDSTWGEVVRPQGEGKRLGAVVAIRFSADELDEIREADPEARLTRFIHAATLKEARGCVEQRRRESDVTGFTLVELLIVIVVLGLLAAVVIFALGGMTNLPREQAAYDTKQVVQAAEVIASGEHSSLGAVLIVDQKQLIQTSPANSIQFAGARSNNSYFTVIVHGPGSYLPTATCLVVPANGSDYTISLGACKTSR
jgi:general secretion pathway protein G